jgi:hypothetical protein
MNLIAEIILIFSALVSVYALGVSILSFRAIKQKRYEAYRLKQADFDRLDREVREAFGENK